MLFDESNDDRLLKRIDDVVEFMWFVTWRYVIGAIIRRVAPDTTIDVNWRMKDNESSGVCLITYLDPPMKLRKTSIVAKTRNNVKYLTFFLPTQLFIHLQWWS